VEEVDSALGSNGAVLAPSGGLEDGLDHGLDDIVELVRGDRDGGLDELERGGVGGHALRLRQSILAWDREARRLARLVDLRGNRGGSGLVWGVGAGGGGEGEKEDEGEKQYGGHGCWVFTFQYFSQFL
jgi:hypothetical protein